MSEKKENHQGFNIELSEEVSEGTYSNLAIIQHSSSEFIFDFVRIMPGVPKGKVKSRIVMTPEHAKKLMRALNDNISKYESNETEYLKADLDDTKLSWDAPNPNAPPSDFCKSTETTKRIANIIFSINMKFSITAIYSNFLL
mgnify:CR=1 FL=1